MWSSHEDGVFVDSALTYDGSPTTSGTGAEHLRLETVSVMADGETHPDITIGSSGEWSIDSAASKVHLGLPYTSRFKSLRIVVRSDKGSSIGQKKKITHISVNLLNSLGGQYGPAAFLKSIIYDADDELFTGVKSYTFQGRTAEDPRVIIQTNDPQPFTMLALVPQTEINER